MRTRGTGSSLRLSVLSGPLPWRSCAGPTGLLWGPRRLLGLFWAGKAECWSFMCKRNSAAPQLCRRVDLVYRHGPRGVKLIIIIIKIFLYLRIYRLSLHFLRQHWSQLSLGTDSGGPPPRPPGSWAPRRGGGRLAASGVGGWLLQAFQGQLAPVRGVGARGATGVGAVRWSRVFGRIRIGLLTQRRG